MKIVIIRHGKTDKNTENRLSGNSHAAKLTDLGREHAGKLIEIFKERNFDAFISSPLHRAIETAEPLSKVLSLEIEKNDLIREFDFGLDDGEIIEGEVLERLEKRRTDLDFQFPEGESMNDVINRAKEFIKNLLLKDYENVLIIAHHRINTALLGVLLEIDFNNPENVTGIGQKNPVIYEVDSVKKSCKWEHSITGEVGEGLIYDSNIV
mgnify:CR=1 FL=1|jgi:broad specificity phosphatase PhoE